MNLLTFLTALASSYWGFSYALTVPVRLPILSLPNSAFNTTKPFVSMSTTNPISIPISFHTTTSFLKRGYRPMAEKAFYHTTLSVMSELSLHPQQTALPDWKLWELPTYGIRAAFKTTQIRYAVWGLWLGVQRDSEAGFWPIVLKMAWAGDPVGQIVIAPRQSLDSGITDGSALLFGSGSPVALLQTVALNVTNAGVQGPPDDYLHDNHVQYNIIPNGRRITVRHLFHTLFPVLVTAAERDARTSFLGDNAGDFTFVPVLDAGGRSLMVYGDLIKVVTYVAVTAVEEDRFQEVDIEIVRDGVWIGCGRLRDSRGGEGG